MEERVISTQIQEEDLTIETSLRPQTLIDYIGQAKTKENLKVYIEAALLSADQVYKLWSIRICFGAIFSFSKNPSAS